MILFLVWLWLAFSIDDEKSSGSQPFAVLELFTSEGRNTSLPAEKLLSDLKADAEKNNKNIYFLQYHVDYWNKLGWKDPYSSFQYTNRQKNYTSVLDEEGLYTPMIVVNGRKAFTGSDENAVRAAIAAALEKKSILHKLSAVIDSAGNDSLYIHYEYSNPDKNIFVRAALTEDDLVSHVQKGENVGKTLKHDAVVRSLVTGTAKNSGQLKLPLKKNALNKNCSLIIFAQQKQTMEIYSVISLAVTR
jgi:hypothetical protein